MAEGLLGGVLGDEDEKPEVESPEALAGAEAFASAVAAKLAGNDPEVARDTSAFLKKHTQLLEIQAEHLKDEHALRVAHLRHQLSEENIRRFGLRLRVGFQLFIVLVATVIGIGIAMMIYDAVTSRRVVIEPFDAPPGTCSPRRRPAKSSLAGFSTNSAVCRMPRAVPPLRATSPAPGRATSVSTCRRPAFPSARSRGSSRSASDMTCTSTGSSSRPRGGLALTVRGNGVPPKSFSRSATELPKLTVEAAEYVYSKSQPARWAVYLVNVERYEEAIAFCRTAVASADPAERPGLLNAWAIAIQNTGGSTREALAILRAAVKLQPDYWTAHSNIQNYSDDAGR